MGKRWKPPVTRHERRFARILRRNGIKFKQSHWISGKCVDFFIPAANVVVEIDGAYHLADTQREKDAERTRVLKKKGGVETVYRLWNMEITPNNPRVQLVLDLIKARLPMGDLIDFCFVELSADSGGCARRGGKA